MCVWCCSDNYKTSYVQTETEFFHDLILTRSSADAENPCDTFRGQSRSPKIVPFHMLGIVSSCAIVTLCSRCAIFSDIRLQKSRDLEIRVRGHSRSLKVVPFDKLCMISY